MIACLAIGLLSATPTSGATPSTVPLSPVSVAPGTTSGAVYVNSARVTAAPENCSDARRAIVFYSAKLKLWRSKMGAGVSRVMRESTGESSRLACPHVRRLAHTLQRKAHDARLAYLNWHYYHYRWDHWLPAKWYRIARCETGVRWDWDSGKYVSAFGIIRNGFSQYAHEIGQLSWDQTRSRLGRYPTPREQYNVALRIHYHFGLSGWGCRAA